MKILKTHLALLLCAALCLPIWSVAAAAEPEQAEPVKIVKLFDPNQAVGQLPILQMDSDIAAGLPAFVYGYYTRFDMVECPVVWDTSTLTSPGRYTISGTVSAPEGYILTEGAGLEQSSINVAVYEDEPVVFFDVLGMTEDGLYGVQALALGGAGPTAPYEEVNMISPDGDCLTVPVAWDFSAVDIGTLGRQTAFATPILPPGAGFATENTNIPQRFYVMEPDAVDLGACNISGQTIDCEWLTEIDPQQAVLEISEDGEYWFAATDRIPEEAVHISNCFLSFTTASLEPDKEYFFRLVYEGRCDGVLRVTTTQDSILEPDWGGDRDGGDAGGSKPEDGDTAQKPPAPDDESGEGDSGSESDTPPPSATPPPTPPTKTTPPAVPVPPQSKPPQQEAAPAAESKPAAEVSVGFKELFGEKRDLISGTRLLMMVDSTNQARFSKQGVTVTFSPEAVRSLDLQHSDRIAVTIEKEGADSFSFSLLVNDEPVANLENTRLMVPYALQTPGATLSLRDAAATEVAKGSYDAALAVASFTVNTTGRFSIAEEIIEEESVPAAPAPQAPKAPIWPAVGIMAALLVAATCGFLLQRRLRP